MKRIVMTLVAAMLLTTLPIGCTAPEKRERPASVLDAVTLAELAKEIDMRAEGNDRAYFSRYVSDDNTVEELMAQVRTSSVASSYQSHVVTETADLVTLDYNRPDQRMFFIVKAKRDTGGWLIEEMGLVY